VNEEATGAAVKVGGKPPALAAAKNLSRWPVFAKGINNVIQQRRALSLYTWSVSIRYQFIEMIYQLRRFQTLNPTCSTALNTWGQASQYADSGRTDTTE